MSLLEALSRFVDQLKLRKLSTLATLWWLQHRSFSLKYSCTLPLSGEEDCTGRGLRLVRTPQWKHCVRPPQSQCRPAAAGWLHTTFPAAGVSSFPPSYSSLMRNMERMSGSAYAFNLQLQLRWVWTIAHQLLGLVSWIPKLKIKLKGSARSMFMRYFTLLFPSASPPVWTRVPSARNWPEEHQVSVKMKRGLMLFVPGV